MTVYLKTKASDSNVTPINKVYIPRYAILSITAGIANVIVITEAIGLTS
jgi:hypothetical protein